MRQRDGSFVILAEEPSLCPVSYLPAIGIRSGPAGCRVIYAIISIIMVIFKGGLMLK